VLRVKGENGNEMKSESAFFGVAGPALAKSIEKWKTTGKNSSEANREEKWGSGNGDKQEIGN